MPNVKTSDETAAGALTGTELVRIVQSAANAQTTTQDIANLAASGGSGLYSQVLSALPTIASTGLSTWANQGVATVADGTTGLVIAAALASEQISGRTKSAPSTPYNIDVLIDWETSTNNAAIAAGPVFGWYDGTKIQVMVKYVASGGAHEIFVMTYNNLTSGSNASIVHKTIVGVARRQWLRIGDDGTNVSWSALPGGDYNSPVVLFSQVKASGSIANYNTIIFGVNHHAGQCSAILHSMTQR